MTHVCPGGCGTQIVRTRLSCKACWSRLPGPLRDDVNDAYRRKLNNIPGAMSDHLRAVAEATRWYREARDRCPTCREIIRPGDLDRHTVPVQCGGCHRCNGRPQCYLCTSMFCSCSH